VKPNTPLLVNDWSKKYELNQESFQDTALMTVVDHRSMTVRVPQFVLGHQFEAVTGKSHVVH
jgi:hypothetical protein